ncbi:glycoside hydrolase family 10 protein [Cyanobacterium sp. IPPAS B-1200]|uniref:glycoside hydrolase family 10 protein n=1 Tax=Cyanobacterium sp. IPPAS B-1200 TaxID=1562720 RepID=UPI0008525A31|nr:hypothetical protein A5482_01670 [Cyanobacterium sp. IPPAS B-1200]
MKLKSVFLFLCALWLSVIMPLGVYSQSISEDEIRGVWLTNIDSDVLFSAENTQGAIALLADANFNSVYPTVWNWGYTLYPSEVNQQATGVKLDPTEGLQHRDVLQEIITEGHEKKLRVIPWFEFGFMAPADSILAQKHPHWITRRIDKTEIWLEGGVHERVWLNPLHPEVQGFISDLVLEIVRNYDIDGIQFDDHFGYPSELGYDPYTVRLYRQEHNGKLPPPNALNAEWIQWRADKITEYLTTLHSQIKAIKPDIILSISPNPQEFSLEQYLLDWATWEKMGLIDELLLQVYRDNMIAFNREILQEDIQNAKNNIPSAIALLSGLKGRQVPLEMIKQQINSTRAENYGGVSFFFYESLWNFGPESKEERIKFFKDIFS